MIKMYVGLHVKYPLFLSSFNKHLIFLTDFRKNHQISNFMKIRLMGTELFYSDGRTNITKLTVAFRNLAKASKNPSICSELEI
jgi:hypothetical protein